MNGLIHRHGRLRMALFSQHHVDQLELAHSSVAFLSSKFPGRTEEEYRRVLGRYGLTGTTALQRKTVPRVFFCDGFVFYFLCAI